MNKKEEDIVADTMENYIHKRIKIADQQLKNIDPDDKTMFPLFQYYNGQKNALYIILTGHNNPLANPLIINSKLKTHNS